MASHRRVQRLNQLLKEELSRLIRRELKDPRVEMVTVTDVDVSGDLRHAKVYVRSLRDVAEDAVAGRVGAGGGGAEADADAGVDAGGTGNGEGAGADGSSDAGGPDDDAGDGSDDGGRDGGSLAQALDGLRSAEGFLRGTLGRELRIRRVPELHFEADRTLERARRIEELLDRVSVPDGEDDGGA